MKFIVIFEKQNMLLHMCCSLEAREREREGEREAKCLKLRTVKTISTLIRILEIISFASYYKTFLMCSQNPLLLYYSSTQQHSTPQFKAQLSNNTQMVYISGSNKIVSPFCLEKVRISKQKLEQKKKLICCVCVKTKKAHQTNIQAAHCSKQCPKVIKNIN